jgi:hypothetical protein
MQAGHQRLEKRNSKQEQYTRASGFAGKPAGPIEFKTYCADSNSGWTAIFGYFPRRTY